MPDDPADALRPDEAVGHAASPVRVLWLVKGMARGGAETLLLLEARVRDRDRIRVSVAYLAPQHRVLVPELEAEDVPVTCIGGRRAWDLRWLLRLRHLLGSGEIDVVHVHSPVPAVGARLVRLTIPRRRRPRLVGTEHNVWASHHRLTRAAEIVTFPLEDHHFAVSEGVKASVPARFRDRVEVVRHGVELDAVRAEADRAAVRRELGLAPDDLVVGTVANVRSQKGYPDLLDAAAAVLADPRLTGRSVRFLAVGKGPLDDEIAVRHRALGLGERFQLLGYRDDAVRVISALDVFCLASHHEGLPVALMEALALGVPVVATAVGGVPELVRDGVEGRLVPARQPDLLAAALVDVIADDDERDRLASGAATRGEGLSIEAAQRRHEAIYATLATR